MGGRGPVACCTDCIVACKQLTCIQKQPYPIAPNRPHIRTSYLTRSLSKHASIFSLDTTCNYYYNYHTWNAINCQDLIFLLQCLHQRLIIIAALLQPISSTHNHTVTCIIHIPLQIYNQTFLFLDNTPMVHAMIVSLFFNSEQQFF